MASIHNHNLQEEAEATLDAVLLANSFVLPMVLNTAIELDLFGIIATAGKGIQLSASEIASHLPAAQNPEASSMIDRMMRLFATHSLVSSSLRTSESGRIERVYGLKPVCRFFIPDNNNQDGYLGPFFALSSHRATFESWLNMKDGILEGGNMFKKVHGMTVFEYMDKDPIYNGIFHQSMAGLSTLIMKAILDVYKGFEGVDSLVDVGGGTGTVLNMIISKYPSIKGINFDLPHVIATAPSYPGIQHVGGSVLTSIPKGEAIMIKDTCHIWTDERVIKVLKNIHEALPRNGKMIIMNTIVGEGDSAPETSKASQYVSRLDNMMLAHTSGKERTAQEFQDLTMAAGFSNFSVVCVAHGVWAVMESYK